MCSFAVFNYSVSSKYVLKGPSRSLQPWRSGNAAVRHGVYFALTGPLALRSVNTCLSSLSSLRGKDPVSVCCWQEGLHSAPTSPATLTSPWQLRRRRRSLGAVCRWSRRSRMEKRSYSSESSRWGCTAGLSCRSGAWAGGCVSDDGASGGGGALRFPGAGCRLAEPPASSLRPPQLQPPAPSTHRSPSRSCAHSRSWRSLRDPRDSLTSARPRMNSCRPLNQHHRHWAQIAVHRQGNICPFSAASWSSVLAGTCNPDAPSCAWLANVSPRRWKGASQPRTSPSTRRPAACWSQSCAFWGSPVPSFSAAHGTTPWTRSSASSPVPGSLWTRCSAPFAPWLYLFGGRGNEGQFPSSCYTFTWF